jgi:hypothetical protein
MARFGICKQSGNRVDSYKVCFFCDHAKGEYIMGVPSECADFEEELIEGEKRMTAEEFGSLLKEKRTRG